MLASIRVVCDNHQRSRAAPFSLLPSRAELSLLATVRLRELNSVEEHALEHAIARPRELAPRGRLNGIE